MPPKRKHDNVDVDEDEEGEGEDDVKTIWIVSPSTEKREQFMCELCSSVLKSAASLVRHKKRHQKSRLESDDKYMCKDCGMTSKTLREHSNHKRKHQTSNIFLMVRYYISDLIRNYPFSVSPLFQAVALKM